MNRDFVRVSHGKGEVPLLHPVEQLLGVEFPVRVPGDGEFSPFRCSSQEGLV